MTAAFALANGAEYFAIFLVVMFIGATLLFSRSGSAINQRPYGNQYDSAAGARGNSTLGNDRAAAERLTKRRKKG